VKISNALDALVAKKEKILINP